MRLPLPQNSNDCRRSRTDSSSSRNSADTNSSRKSSGDGRRRSSGGGSKSEGRSSMASYNGNRRQSRRRELHDRTSLRITLAFLSPPHPLLPPRHPLPPRPLLLCTRYRPQPRLRMQTCMLRGLSRRVLRLSWLPTMYLCRRLHRYRWRTQRATKGTPPIQNR